MKKLDFVSALAVNVLTHLMLLQGIGLVPCTKGEHCRYGSGITAVNTHTAHWVFIPANPKQDSYQLLSHLTYFAIDLLPSIHLL